MTVTTGGITDVPSDDQQEDFDPRAYLKVRRPHLFSDSQIKQELAPIDRNQLEYALETLTFRQEEIRFEQFARHLAKKEICPNLIPHTGPTGGGDGKTDSENYQVSEEIAALWYIGDPRRASAEKFAFCFSAKKDWKTKCRADIASVLGTGRNFSVIYFITNQFVPSRERAELQDKYAQETGKEIKILDRQWITDCVIDHQHWNLVSQHLGIGDSKSVAVEGPRDAQYKSYLEQLEKELAEAEYQGLQFAEDCLEAALVARNLGLPSHEVVGRFERAERASEKIGSKIQLFRIIYKRAWTVYWWYNDLTELSRLYDKAESLVIENDSSFILQDLASLCQIGITASKSKRFADLVPVFAERAAKLKKAFENIARAFPDSANGFWAQTYICNLDLISANHDGDGITEFSKTLMSILANAKRHAGYPVEAVYQIVCVEFSNYIVENDAFDELFELVMDIQSERVSETTKGKTRLERGLQLYEKGKDYQAIDHLTKAQVLLAKDETVEEYVLAAFAAGVAYGAVGLLWAARANMAVAISLFMQHKLRSGAVIPEKIMLFLQEYVGTELVLGRPFCALQVLELALMLASEMTLTERRVEKFQRLDAMMARLILETSISDLAKLERLPDVLQTYLELSAGSLLFCLGHDEEAKKRLQHEEIEEICGNIIPLTNQEMGTACSPDWYFEGPYTLRSKILGCELELKAHDVHGIFIGESLLAFVENFLATAVMLKNCIATRSKAYIDLKFEADSNFKLAEEEDDCGEITTVIRYSFDDLKDFADPKQYSEKLFQCTVSILKQMGLTFDKESLDELFSKHEILNRSQFAASSLTSVLKLFGDRAKYTYANWLEERPNAQRHTLRRKERWLRATNNGLVDAATDSSDSAPPLDKETLHQKDFSFYSPIDLHIWSRAGWNGTAFGTIEGDLSRIEFWLTFKDFEVGKKIFRGWRKRVGPVDKDEWLAISIVTGIDAQHPAHYRVVLSINEDYIKAQRGGKGLTLISPATFDVTPATSANLDRFLAAYAAAGWYDFGPAQIVGQQFDCAPELFIRKKSLRVTPAWKIDERDSLFMALNRIENPLVPKEVPDAPIWTAIEKYQLAADKFNAKRS